MSTNFIEYKEEQVVVRKLTCSHPKIKKIWEYGGCAEKPNNSEMVRYLSLLWYEGDKECRREFKDNGNWSAIIEAEKFLQSLPIN